MKNKISGLITTYNESRFLEECLSRLSFCDEIIVVDLGSSDNCVEIARRFGTTVLTHELVPFAEKVRNFAISHAKNDWVLFADPDMYFPHGIGEKIDTFLETCPPEIGIIHIPAKKFYRNQPIRYGTKSAIESRQALINTRRVDFQPLVHYSGINPKENIISVGLLVTPEEYIAHYWVNSMDEAVEKALRYLPYEPERRHEIYKKFSIRIVVRELVKMLVKEINMGALKNWLSFRILIFNFWYILQANVRWARYELQKKNL